MQDAIINWFALRGVSIEYFGAKRSLLGALHQPQRLRPRSTAVLLCNPFGEEASRSHRIYRVLATQLERAGFAALRFDYSGTGGLGGRRARRTRSTPGSGTSPPPPSGCARSAARRASRWSGSGSAPRSPCSPARAGSPCAILSCGTRWSKARRTPARADRPAPQLHARRDRQRLARSAHDLAGRRCRMKRSARQISDALGAQLAAIDLAAPTTALTADTSP